MPKDLWMHDVQVKLAQNDAVSSLGCSSSREIPEKFHGSKIWELQEAGGRDETCMKTLALVRCAMAIVYFFCFVNGTLDVSFFFPACVVFNFHLLRCGYLSCQRLFWWKVRICLTGWKQISDAPQKESNLFELGHASTEIWHHETSVQGFEGWMSLMVLDYQLVKLGPDMGQREFLRRQAQTCACVRVLQAFLYVCEYFCVYIYIYFT